MTFAALTAMFVQRAWRLPVGITAVRTTTARSMLLVFTAAGVATTLLIVIPLYRGEAARQSARDKIDGMAPGRGAPNAAVLRSAREELIEATKLSPRNGRAWADLAYVTTALIRFDVSRAKDLGREAEQAANQALRLSDDVAEFWMRKGVALDMQGRWVEAGSAFAQALQLAPTRAGAWYQQAAHLGLNPVERERALAAVGVALRLDPGNPEAHALRQRLAERSHAP
jgi:tetratricopeptide (TPR) repeat protein